MNSAVNSTNVSPSIPTPTQNPIASLNSASLPSASASANSFTNLFSHFDWRIWLFLIFILAFFGVNIFLYLAKGTQSITDIIKPITDYFGNLFSNTTKQIVDVSATGAKAGIDVAAGTVTTGLDTAGNIAGAAATSSQGGEPITNTGAPLNNSLNTALNSATDELKQNGGEAHDSPSYEADDSYSSIQASKTAGKSGWCFIGEDRGFRSCIEVGDNDQCMSGDIFPTNDICVNPNLRA
jgi:hypothetical protein